MTGYLATYTRHENYVAFTCYGGLNITQFLRVMTMVCQECTILKGYDHGLSRMHNS